MDAMVVTSFNNGRGRECAGNIDPAETWSILENPPWTLESSWEEDFALIKISVQCYVPFYFSS